MIEKYRECVQVCSAVNYSDQSSVNKCNKAVDEMYSIVEQANKNGANAISEIVTLLDEEGPAKWLSHQLVERAEISKEVRAKCILIVEALAKGGGANALGERMWLKEHAGYENR